MRNGSACFWGLERRQPRRGLAHGFHANADVVLVACFRIVTYERLSNGYCPSEF
jgi:hypothetical protein